MDDRELAVAIAANDPRGLDGAYRRYAGPLLSYSRSLIGDGDAAADAVQDTFLLASRNIGQLRDPDRLRPWLYAIARHEALRQLKQRARHEPLETAPEPVQDTLDLASAVHSEEIASVVHAAKSGLSDGAREIAELAIRHNMSAPEIAAVMDVPLNHAHAQLSKAREQLLISLEALMLARGNRDACPGLAEILKDWDGELTPLLRKRINRHAEGCESCGEARKTRLNPAVLLSGYAAMPFAIVPELELKSATPAAEPKWHRDTGFPVQSQPSKKPSVALAAAAAAIVLFLGGGATAVMLSKMDEPAAQPPMTPRSGSPMPSASPSPSPSPSPSSEPSFSPSPVVTKTSSKPAAPPPLVFTATGSATCNASGQIAFVVNVSANVVLDTASLKWPATAAMTVNQKNAVVTVSANGSSSPATLAWHVEVTARDGRFLRGPDQTTDNPCY
ncbi:RNA polymerase sigma factor [Catelliglobosispora koreensis]|uniref:RNA polymerase sigma factor n=1 Tax=Catelliglobosispora koreensis TaxID=129052 RepID=UPI00146D28B7|nr:sigma-70 family RNA polymerase sigma factor [Catelliglobosispora koreensis]